MKVIFSILLQDDGSPSERKKYIRLPPPNPENPYKVRFILPAGCDALRHGKIMTNYPIGNSKKFDRKKFSAIPFDYDYMADGSCEFEITQAGAFEYFMEYSPRFSKQPDVKMGYFIVDPRLIVPGSSFRILDEPASPEFVQNDHIISDKSRDYTLNMNSICILTVVPKWIGKISEWRSHFQHISYSGYNAIHFVPLQKRGSSNSPYSLFDQLALSDDLFDPIDQQNLNNDGKFKLLKQELDYLQSDLGLLSLTDVVWNHTAHNSDWLAEHPESGYNLMNSPHLIPAYELDEAILQFSADIKRYNLSGETKNMEQLTHLLEVFKTQVLDRLELWKYYVLNVEDAISELSDRLKGISVPEKTFIVSDDVSALSHQQLATMLLHEAIYHETGVKFGKKINSEFFYALIIRRNHLKVSLNNFDEKSIIKDARAILDALNLTFYQEYDQDIAQAMENIKSRAIYERIAEHGPKLASVSSENPLAQTYFTRIPRCAANQNFDWKSLIVANNGWIWNADPLVDFAGPSSKSYFIREVIPWGDCVKLRYGKGRDDNPWLWDYMAKYTCLLAKYFHGFRIDNCHSTPLHVAQYFLDLARQVRADLYVIAELFTGSEERDITFVSKLGINSLIREAMNAWDTAELSRLVHKYGGQPVGSLALRADYLPLELVGHEPASIHSPLLDNFYQKQYGWHENPQDDEFYVQSIEDPDESGRKTPLKSRALSRRRSNYFKNSISDKKDDMIVAPNISESNGSSNQRKQKHIVRSNQKLPEVNDNQEVVFRLEGSAPHALFMDCTHDNEMPNQKRTVEDTLSTAAIVSMTDSAVGSVKGYDELVPYHLNIVEENRKYEDPSKKRGITQAKRRMLHLHYLMGQKGYTEIYVHQEADFVTVSRQNPVTHHGYLLIARTAFHRTTSDQKISPIVLRNTSYKTFLSSKIVIHSEKFSQNDEFINGIDANVEISYAEPLPGMVSIDVGKDDLGTFINIVPEEFPPGSIILLETDLLGQTLENLEKFRDMMALTVHGAWYLDGIVRSNMSSLKSALKALSLEELNVILYRSDPEERDSTGGHGVYDVPNFGKLSYAGLQGFYSVLREISKNNDLGHPLCDHLRSGYWAMDYITERLKRYLKEYPNLQSIITWLELRFALVKELPNFLIPKYFNIVVSTASYVTRNYCISRMSEFVMEGNRFIRSLAVGAIQLYGKVPSTGLSPIENTASLSAGLPHFTTNHMRCWGRDIFISLRGLFLVTGLHSTAKTHILHFASAIKHGLIPNLLDSGRFPRYNSRDSVWFFLQAIQEYCKFVPNGCDILEEVVNRRFESDEFISVDDSKAFSKKSKLKEIIHEIMQRHASGIKFVEWNAGPQLDHAMRPEGFNVEINFDPKTGLLFGGNRFNCGTWMDKMGDSEKARIKGLPATPRDGAAVEITGLLKSCVRWLSELHRAGKFFEGVDLGNGKQLKYREWNDLIQENFERCYFIPSKSEEDKYFEVDSELIQTRGIYKDTFKSSIRETDYQHRPNVFIAMTVAPELFHDRKKAALALKNARVLRGPVGMKTLDPRDPNYRGFYDNDNDSADPHVAHGINYHQGPEWVWMMGFYLRALYTLSKAPKTTDCGLVHDILRVLSPHRQMLQQSLFAGLPELTNRDGVYCPHSCENQAWSMATILDLLYDLQDDVLVCSLTENPILSDIIISGDEV